MGSSGGTTTISLSRSPLNIRSSNCTDLDDPVIELKFLGHAVTLVETVADVVGLGIDQVHLLVPGEHRLAQLRRPFRTKALFPVIEGLFQRALVIEPASGQVIVAWIARHLFPRTAPVKKERVQSSTRGKTKLT